MILGTLKTYAIVAASAVLSVLLIVTRVLLTKNAKLKVDKKIAVAKEKRTKAVMKHDIEVDEQIDDHLAEVTKEIEDEKHPSELLDPNANHWD